MVWVVGEIHEEGPGFVVVGSVGGGIDEDLVGVADERGEVDVGRGGGHIVGLTCRSAGVAVDGVVGDEAGEGFPPGAIDVRTSAGPIGLLMKLEDVTVFVDQDSEVVSPLYPCANVTSTPLTIGVLLAGDVGAAELCHLIDVGLEIARFVGGVAETG